MVRGEKQNKLLFLGMFAFLCFVMWCTPYSSDDFEFAALEFSGSGAFWDYVLHYGNGRVLGNVFSIGLVQLPSLAVVVKALAVTSVIFLFPAVLKMDSLYGILASFLLLMLVKPEMFGEVYTWTCGFSNYLMPVWLTLLILYLLQKYPQILRSGVRSAAMVLIFLLGMASQLFVEHATVIHVFMALSAVALCFRLPEGKRLRSPSVLWLAGVLVGAAVMFLLPVLCYTDGSRTEGYRSVNLGGLGQMVYSAVRNFIRLGNHFMGTNGIPVCLGAVLTTYLTRDRRSGRWNDLLYMASLVVLGYTVCNAALIPNNWYGRQTMVYHVVTAVMGLLPFALWLLAALSLEGRFRLKILGLLALAILSWGMFLIVSPTPVRVVFQSYLFAAAALMLCVEKCLAGVDEKLLAGGKRALCAASCALVLVIGLIFFSGHKMAVDRENLILREMSWGSTAIEVFEIPYEYIFWDSEWCLQYYYYHTEPGDIQFTSIDYYTWAHRYAGGY